MVSAMPLSVSTSVSMVTSGCPGNLRCSASFKLGYISRTFHSPPKSYSVPSASVTFWEPKTSSAQNCTSPFMVAAPSL